MIPLSTKIANCNEAKNEQSIHINYTTRKFLCLESFSSEGRHFLKDGTYKVPPIAGGYVLSKRGQMY